MTHFDARLSRIMKGYTIVLLAGIGGWAAYCLLSGDTMAGFIMLGAFGAVLLPGLFSVQGYDLDQGQLIIQRPGRRTFIDLSGLVEVAPAEKLVRRSMSLWSTRGLFGFIGYGYNSSLGVYRAYVTNSAKAVALRFREGKAVVISPESPDTFVATLIAESRATVGSEHGAQ